MINPSPSASHLPNSCWQRSSSSQTGISDIPLVRVLVRELEVAPSPSKLAVLLIDNSMLGFTPVSLLFASSRPTKRLARVQIRVYTDGSSSRPRAVLSRGPNIAPGTLLMVVIEHGNADGIIHGGSSTQTVRFLQELRGWRLGRSVPRACRSPFRHRQGS